MNDIIYHTHDKVILCIDIEASCFNDCKIIDMEMIEIGIIALSEDGNELSRFQSFVLPQFTELTKFCTEITNINAGILETAPTLNDVAKSLQDWFSSLPSRPVCWYSWGDFDRRLMDQDFKRLDITPTLPSIHHDAKKLFQKKYLKGSKRVGMKKALDLMNIEFEGKPHSAIDDAHNLLRLYPYFAPKEKVMNDKISGIIKDACLLRFGNAPEQYKEITTLCGTVVKDFRGRFRPGNWFRSSVIIEVKDDLVITRNSIYQIEGELEEVVLPTSVASEVIKGTDPRMIRGMLDEGYKFVTDDKILAETSKDTA